MRLACTWGRFATMSNNVLSPHKLDSKATLVILSDLQRDDAYCRQDDGHNPEANGDFRFMELSLGPSS